MHNVRKVEVPGGHELDYPRLIDVDPHAHVEGQCRLLDVAVHPAPVVLDHSERDRNLLRHRRDGQRGLLLTMEGDERAEVEIRDDVPVHDEECLFEIVDRP
jgi:hypothetical protein